MARRRLHRAAICDSVDIIQLLLDYNVDIEIRSLHFGRSALHWAAVYGYLGVISLLIAKGASVETRDERRWTVLHLVASRGHAMRQQRALLLLLLPLLPKGA